MDFCASESQSGALPSMPPQLSGSPRPSDIDTADVAGLAAASGVLTAMGGRTAHASLIGRPLGKACVVSCAGLMVNASAHRAELGGTAIREGDWLSIDGDIGEVFVGQREIVTERPETELAEIEAWRHNSKQRLLSMPLESLGASAPK
jgi:phosphoenolpyruvate synthase/pyruvate phosphate dikinase